MELLWYCDIIKHVIYCNIKSLKYHINSNMGGCQFEQEGNDFYIVGADSVRKKLGNASDCITINGISFNHTFKEGGGDGGTTGSTYIELNLTPFSTVKIGSISNYTVKIDGANVSSGATIDVTNKSKMTIQSSVNHYTYVNNSSASWSGSISSIKLYF